MTELPDAIHRQRREIQGEWDEKLDAAIKAAFGDPPDVSDIKRLLWESPDRHLRGFCVMALVHLGGGDAEYAVIIAAADHDRYVQAVGSSYWEEVFGKK
jgi:hypothetical protein